MQDNYDGDIDILSHLFNEYFGAEVTSVRMLPGAGSNRKYFRMSGRSVSEGGVDKHCGCIGTVGDDEHECRAFVKLGKVFRKNGVSVPEVYSVTSDYMHYIQQDLGDTSLMDIILQYNKRNFDPNDPLSLGSTSLSERIRKVLRQLSDMQQVPSKLWLGCTEYKPFCIRQALWDLNYFKYEYLKPAAVIFDEEALQDDLEAFAESLCSDNGFNGFMFRDFQSRNVMIHDDQPWFIDFQGGRMGPGIYDAVSFLWQAKANFSKAFRYEMIDEYVSNFPEGVFPTDKEGLRNLVNRFVLFRTLQVLGAYGFRGLVEKKAHFIESIPQALQNLSEVAATGVMDSYRELKRVCSIICNDKRFEKTNREKLLITIYSFSYKKGYPEDFTGNGGGFMFDCRGMHNPGRYPEYRKYTGLDKPVIDFLENRGEIQKFLKHVLDVVEPSVNTYFRRNFTNLQIGFGCTGGQHRSVYCAEHLAKELKERFPEVEIEVIHREQNIKKLL